MHFVGAESGEISQGYGSNWKYRTNEPIEGKSWYFECICNSTSQYAGGHFGYTNEIGEYTTGSNYGLSIKIPYECLSYDPKTGDLYYESLSGTEKSYSGSNQVKKIAGLGFVINNDGTATIDLYVDGEKINSVTENFQDNGTVYIVFHNAWNHNGFSGKFMFDLENIKYIDIAKKYRNISDNVIYVNSYSDSVISFDVNGDANIIATKYSSLSEEEKISLFDGIRKKVPLDKIKSLGTSFRVLKKSVNNIENTTIKAIPKTQLVLPAKLISTKDYESVNGASFVGNTVSGEQIIHARFDGYICETGQKVVKQIGNPYIDTTNAKFGSGCLRLDEGSYVTIEDERVSKLKTNNFTIEFWAKIDEKKYAGIIAVGANTEGTSDNDNIQISMDRNGQIVLTVCYSTASTWSIYGQTGHYPNEGNWEHYAIVRDGGNLYLYKSGERIYSANIGESTSLKVLNNKVALGKGNYFGNMITAGYYDELLITDGVAKYKEATYELPTEEFESTVSKIKFAVTTDLSKYYSYSDELKDWVEISKEEIPSKGMYKSEVEALTYEEWSKLVQFGEKDSGFAFAYSFDLESSDDELYLDELTLNVDMAGTWNKAVYGTDYTYGYPAKDKLQVKLLTNGSYKINFVR